MPTAKRNITATFFFCKFSVANLFAEKFHHANWFHSGSIAGQGPFFFRKCSKRVCQASANVFNLQHIGVPTYLFDHVVLASLSDGLIRFESVRQPRDRSRTSSTNQVMRLGSMALQNQKFVFTRVAPRFHMPGLQLQGMRFAWRHPKQFRCNVT